MTNIINAGNASGPHGSSGVKDKSPMDATKLIEQIALNNQELADSILNMMAIADGAGSKFSDALDAGGWKTDSKKADAELAKLNQIVGTLSAKGLGGIESLSNHSGLVKDINHPDLAAVQALLNRPEFATIKDSMTIQDLQLMACASQIFKMSGRKADATTQLKLMTGELSKEARSYILEQCQQNMSINSTTAAKVINKFLSLINDVVGRLQR
jgi:hypothetical protein